MNRKTDGGAAFPLPNGASEINGTGGMSLRDWFAGQVLAGIVGNDRSYATLTDYRKSAAEYAYATADAMLEARNRSRE